MEPQAETTRDALRRIAGLIRDGQIIPALEAYETLADRLAVSGPAETLADVRFKSAQLLQQLDQYDQSLDRLLAAARAGLSSDRVAAFLPRLLGPERLAAARTAYEKATAGLRVHGGPRPEFDALQLLFLPLPDGGYAIFDRASGFVDAPPKPLNHVAAETDFSDYLIVAARHAGAALPVVKEAARRQRDCCLLTEQPEYFFAFLQLPKFHGRFDAAEIFLSAAALQEHLTATGRYLPRHLVASDETEIRRLHELLETEHHRRLTQPGGNRPPILLSIAIPSWNRGHRALAGVRHLLHCRFDHEIEIMVSDNDSDRNLDGYREIAAMSDSRLRYWRNDRNLEFIGNILKLMEQSRGQFTMLISDEDYVSIDHFDALLTLLRGQDRLAWLRPSVAGTQGAQFPEACHERGLEALRHGMLRNNYLTGIIYNTAMFAACGAAEYIRSHPDNEACFIYPHMVADILMSYFGDIRFSPLICCLEGADENNTPADKLSRYQTVEGRMKQHQGFFVLLADQIRRHHPPVTAAATLLLTLTKKTAFLLKVNISHYCHCHGREEDGKRIYFDSIMNLYHHVATDDFAVLRELYDAELPEEERDRFRTLFHTLIRDIS